VTLSTTVFPASGLTYTWTPPAPPTFCASSATSSFDEVITNVSLGSLNNTTVCGIIAPGAGSIADRYGNYTTLTAPDLSIGVSYPASVSVGTCGGYYGTFTNTYIDWNGDQDFLDAGETVYTSLSTPGAATLTYNVLVPAGTVPGLKRMRIVHVEYATPSSCGTYSYGETEDYNVNIVAAPSCLPPSVLTAAAITAAGANLGWTEGGTATTWNVEYGVSGFTQGAGTVVTGTATNPYAVSGLTANTAYAFYVQSICGSSLSTWTGPFAFTTPCATFTAPYLENYDAALATPACWTNVTGGEPWSFQVSGGAGPGYGVAGSVDHTTGSGNFAWIDASSGIGANQLISPVIDFSGLTSPEVGYWIKSNNTNETTQNTLQLSAWDGAAWVVLDTYGANNAAWVKVSAIVPAGIPTTTQFRLAQIQSPTGTPFYNDLLVDDFYVNEAPSCLSPTALTATNITTTGASLGWTSTGTLWDIELGAAGFTPTGTPSTVGTTTNSLALTGLTSATSYHFYVRNDCGSSSLSTWAGPFAFTTLADYCAGDHFYDTGGASGNYSDNENITTVISPTTSGDVVTVTFSSFNIENNWDFLRVYDGPNATATLLANLTGTTIPGPFTSTHASGSLTFVFTSDGSVNLSGWDATVVCALPACLAPTLSTVAATCSSPGTATVSNYDATSTYVSTPAGATVGALGVITATAGTAYTLTAANATCGALVASASFTIDVQLTEPVAPAVTTTVATCTSSGTATVSNYDTTLTYVSTPVGATVGALGVITATSGTAYTLTAANATCTSVASASFTNDVQLPEPAAPSVTTTAASCTSPGTATVSNYDTTLTYVSTPAGGTVGALGVITATAGTAYTFTAANATCTSVASVSFTNDVQLTEPVAPAVTTTVATCTSSGTATVSNYDATLTYVSTPVGATVGALGVITATSGTAYTLTAANATCTSVASVSVTIAVQLAAPVAVATDNGDATLTATAGTGYVWIDCATNTAIAGATAQTFAPTVNGNYAVVLTNAAGCSDTSVCVTIANIGIKEIAGTGVSIYPNPTSSDVVINFPSNSASIEVMDATGKVVSTSTITTGGKVTLADFNRGIYYIRLNTENGTSIHKVVKN